MADLRGRAAWRRELRSVDGESPAQLSCGQRLDRVSIVQAGAGLTLEEAPSERPSESGARSARRISVAASFGQRRSSALVLVGGLQQEIDCCGALLRECSGSLVAELAVEPSGEPFLDRVRLVKAREPPGCAEELVALREGLKPCGFLWVPSERWRDFQSCELES